MLIPLGKTNRLSPAPDLSCRLSPRAESLICPCSRYVLSLRSAQCLLGWGAAVRLGIYRVANTPEDRWFPINVFNHVGCGSRQGCVPRGAASSNPGVRQWSEPGATLAAGKRRVGMNAVRAGTPHSPVSAGAQHWVCSCGEGVGNVLLPGEGQGGCRGRGGCTIRLTGSCSVFQCFGVWHSWAVPTVSPVAAACPLYLGKTGMLVRLQLLWAPMPQNTKNCSGPFPSHPKMQRAAKVGRQLSLTCSGAWVVPGGGFPSERSIQGSQSQTEQAGSCICSGSM